MRLRTLLTATATALTLTAAGTGAGAASAATVDHLPAPTTGPAPTLPDGGTNQTIFWADEAPSQWLVSPYTDGKPLRCKINGPAHSKACWQHRPDGKWTSLIHIGPLMIYPVWEDPASLLRVLEHIPGLPTLGDLTTLPGLTYTH